MTASANFAPESVSGGGPSSSGTLEETQVRAMFDRIAGLYDRMNTVMTAGLHHRWRRRAADLAQCKPGGRALDVATGTGDLALEMAGRVAPGGTVIGADFSERMLALARAKPSPFAVGRPGADVTLRFETANALSLPYADDEFDAATVGFGARNFSDLEQGLREMARVVRPGGRVVVLEITNPQRPLLSTFFELWFDRVVPALGRLAGDAQAYSYLPSSVRRFPGPEALAGVMFRCGLTRIRYLITAGGIIALHVGEVGETAEAAEAGRAAEAPEAAEAGRAAEAPEAAEAAEAAEAGQAAEAPEAAEAAEAGQAAEAAGPERGPS